MKKFQKLLGLCLIGFLLAVRPISGGDFSAITGEGVGEAIAWVLNSFFLQSLGGEEGEPQLSNEVSDDQIIDFMGFLFFDCERKATGINHSNPPSQGFYFDKSKPLIKEYVEFFETYATNEDHIEQLKRCAKKLFQKKGFELKKLDPLPAIRDSRDYTCSCGVEGNYCYECYKLNQEAYYVSVSEKLKVADKNKDYFLKWGVPLILLKKFIIRGKELENLGKGLEVERPVYPCFSIIPPYEYSPRDRGYDKHGLSEEYMINLYNEVIGGDDTRNIKPAKR